MEEDFISSLTHQVKEEVVERYLSQRRLVEEQITMVNEDAAEVAVLEKGLRKRIYRLYQLLGEEKYVEEFRKLADLEDNTLSPEALGIESLKGVRFIKVWSLTFGGKYRKLVLEAYARMKQWAEEYAETYEELELLCKAVNRNIESFTKEFDLLGLIGFLKSLDIAELKKQRFLGGNFTAKELTQIDKTLMFKKIKFNDFGLLNPPKPPALESVRRGLLGLTDRVCDERRCELEDIVQ